jgi:pimeloyl-ACP methyl ester carboxylesterase
MLFLRPYMEKKTKKIRASARTVATGYWIGGEGRPLVLLQGGMADARAHWAPVWEELSRRHLVIAPDLPGFGETEALGKTDWRSLSLWLAAFLEGIDAGKAVLVGNSFGGTLARAFASYFPACVRGVVLVDGGQYLQIDGFRKLVLASPVGRLLFSARAKRGIASQDFRNMMPFYDRLSGAERAAWSARSGEIFRIARGCVLGPLPASSRSVPMSIIWGALDRHAPPERALRLREELGIETATIIDGAGHLPQIDRPADTIDAIEAFLDAIEDRGAG